MTDAAAETGYSLIRLSEDDATPDTPLEGTGTRNEVLVRALELAKEDGQTYSIIDPDDQFDGWVGPSGPYNPAIQPQLAPLDEIEDEETAQQRTLRLREDAAIEQRKRLNGIGSDE